ncbi:PREDICTED: LEAF RUST 10 DISEASE-RESISTANCE LOCUS RECEPTOR-LIKE PROTEIN KINASE-like 2.1 [Camelina sativa]|uniref:LEAF RUST 10 DISEASE-RESISTANCE LOCUS RECEPTOR-LIKE PROTEIN KINASE-like 2.1 n=1 Tax=Camelina sativa TaxID=90675 RepID=A0ABM0ZMQ7_CAMSA|nr:PREDICTED: LEAF RUST 10 DISEASE-RESISTANCE LOCUS RECEPTOR-LIKE PROTEIN KINASE-like 2.1 [Camelina sativa]
MAGRFALLFLLASHLLLSAVMSSRNFTIENKCDSTIWPASYSYKGSLETNGFRLEKGQTRTIKATSSWVGQIWGRTLCSANSSGSFSCVTGDCGTGEIECNKTVVETYNSATSATLAEFNLAATPDDGENYYDVSVIYGYNLPLRVTPENKKCERIKCVVDMNETCPSELRMNNESNNPYACRTSCQQNLLPELCCVGLYVLDKDVKAPENCNRTVYSKTFNHACPDAYSYAYDNKYFTCPGSSNFVITFCPSSTTKPGISPWKLKLIVGFSSGLAMIIIIAIVVKVRASNMRKSDQNRKNMEAFVMLKRFSYSQVKKMTKSFANILGKGGFGTVYKGKLPDGSREIAVKILNETKGNGEEFINEVASMSRTSHVNIVPLLGFCYEGNKKAIIYEFMPNGSLDKFISEKMSEKMEWETLYNIAVGVSRGLEYLHNRCVSRIVHFDIKPQNILMDGEFRPKISDFGLAKLGKNNESIMSMLDARGTAGYIAPEVFSKNFGGVSHKSDVYSYGMVVLEMIGARENNQNAGSNNSSMYFPDWLYKDLDEKGEIMSVFADQIIEKEDKKIVKKMVLVGLWCIQTNPLDRPPMDKVVEMLEGSLEALEIPPKPLLFSSASTVAKTTHESQETSNFSEPSQDTTLQYYFEEGVQDIAEDNQDLPKTRPAVIF